MSQDPDYDGGDGEFLAVAARADRWALARPLARGIEVRAIDPADPGAIISATYRRFSGLAGLAISPDGSTAYAFGAAYVLRVDLAKRKALPLPDLRVKWLGWPHARDFAGGRYRVSARVRISNVSRNRAASVYGQVGFGDGEYAIPLDPYGDGSTSSRPFRLRARSSVVKRFTWEGTYGPADLAGASLAIKIACELPDATPADNTATSRTISPLYAPR
jgi:hypothetical protein